MFYILFVILSLVNWCAFYTWSTSQFTQTTCGSRPLCMGQYNLVTQTYLLPEHRVPPGLPAPQAWFPLPGRLFLWLLLVYFPDSAYCPLSTASVNGSCHCFPQQSTQDITVILGLPSFWNFFACSSFIFLSLFLSVFPHCTVIIVL